MSYLASSMAWGVGVRVIDAGVKFIAIPLLVAQFGKLDFGLLALVIASNAYLQLLDLGINVGAVRFYSKWMESGDHERVRHFAGTSLSFYGAVGILNLFLLLILGAYASSIFQISQDQVELFQTMLTVLAVFSIFNWIGSVANQLLIASRRISLIHQIGLVRVFLHTINLVVTVHMDASMMDYLLVTCIIGLIEVCMLFGACYRIGLLRAFRPRFGWSAYRNVMTYSLGIFSLGIFQVIAFQSRPLILGMFSPKGTEVLTDYRVMEVFTAFLWSIGGMFFSTLMPESSRLVDSADNSRSKAMVLNGVFWTLSILFFVCMPMIIASRDFLMVYVGSEFANLAPWLSLWLLCVIALMLGMPALSITLALGKMRLLVWNYALACGISIVITALFCVSFGAGSAVLGFAIYTALRISFDHLVLYPKILDISVKTQLIRISGILLATTLAAGITILVLPRTSTPSLNLFIVTIVWFVVYPVFFSIFNWKDVIVVKNRIRCKNSVISKTEQ